MRKISLFLMLWVVSMGLSAQTTPKKVQGIIHDGLRNAKIRTQPKQAKQLQNLKNNTDTINFNSILFWVGTGDNRAALVIKWNDSLGNVNARVWGYRWNKNETKTSKDLLTAVANADPRFTVLMQDTGISPATKDTLNYAISGIGYNFTASRRAPALFFDYVGAGKDDNISFHYIPPPNTGMGQHSVPVDPSGEAALAISDGTAPGTGLGKGVIEHPFNYLTYGYPAYDYDHWQLLPPPDSTQSWRAGWYEGYWSFYTKNAPIGSWEYSEWGASQRVLQDNYVDGWSFCGNMSSWYCADMSGEYTPVPVP
ncbi:MAG: hypothetical protein LBP34_08430 [Flavobacteriaceae bacterium]|nr:hypothetical protein [Flavobacteriaceae bacterium]